MCDGWEVDETDVGKGVGAVHTTFDFVPERGQRFGGIVEEPLHTFYQVFHTLTEPQMYHTFVLAIRVQRIFVEVDHRTNDLHKELRLLQRLEVAVDFLGHPLHHHRRWFPLEHISRLESHTHHFQDVASAMFEV